MKTFYTATEMQTLADAHFSGDIIALALSLLDHAARCAVVPVSQFQVGAIAIDTHGNAYFGANQECAMAAMAQTVHAEQSAVAHAWSHGATSLAHIVVNHTPCGHCRQFLNELRDANNLCIHLPHARNNRLADYLPDSFSPADLNMPQRLLDHVAHDCRLPAHLQNNPLWQAALTATNRSHAPYSHAYAGVALRDKYGQIWAGSYAENAAYNPSLPPMQVAVNVLRLQGHDVADVVESALLCRANCGHEAHAQALWSVLSAVPLQVAHWQ